MASKVELESEDENENEDRYEFPNIVNIGGMSYETRLDQILEQLEVPYKEYLWWNSSNKLKLTLPPELYE